MKVLMFANIALCVVNLAAFLSTGHFMSLAVALVNGGAAYSLKRSL